MTKPTVGVVHLHRRWWMPWRVGAMWFQPERRAVMYRVPVEGWDPVLAADSFEQAMAIARGGEQRPVH